MELRTEIQLSTMIRAMSEVILPAIDPANQLAMEQGKLVVGMLNLMTRQLPIQFRFDRDELQRLLDHTQALRELAAADADFAAALADLQKTHESGADILARCTVDPADMVKAIRDLREATGTLVAAAAATGEERLIAPIEAAVMALSKEQLLRDRSLLLPQGWEIDPAAIPAIETLLP